MTAKIFLLDEQLKEKTPGIYVLDSLDSLSDDAELKRNVDKGSYGTGKAKKMSELLRKLNYKVEASDTLLMIISQVRENIGVMRGEKLTRSGGKALGHYAAQEVWLARIETLKRTVGKINRPYGIKIKATIKKNKVGVALRSCEFDFLFGFGIDDVGSSLNWLEEIGRLKEAKIGAVKIADYMKDLLKADRSAYAAEQKRLNAIVTDVWHQTEQGFLPHHSKYG